MKKNSKKIALFLLLVMVVSIFSGCLSWWLMTGEQLDLSGMSGGKDGLGLIFLPVIDVICLPVALIVFAIRMAIQAERDKRGDRLDGIDTFSAIASLSEKDLFFLKDKFHSLSEGEFDSLTQRFASLSETEIASFTKTAHSLSKEEIAAIMNEFYNFTEAEIASSVEMLNSMPEESLISTLNNFQYVEFRSAQ